jgi:hypothetical protein
MRQASLRSEYADAFPLLIAGQWYTAAAVAAYVKAERIVHEGPQVRLLGRVLHPELFHFRGGCPRKGVWAGIRSRRADRGPVLHPMQGGGAGPDRINSAGVPT